MTKAKKVYRSISSMKTGLVLLVLIGLASALGSAAMPAVFFNTILFKYMLVLLLLNMALCTINRTIWFKSRFDKGQIKQDWPRQIGMISLHAGIVLILLGGTIYVCYGQSSQISILTGDTVDISQVMKVKTPFSLKLDEFKIDFNLDGSPSQYYSNVSVLEAGWTKASASVSVNHPLKYGDIKAYQQSFGYLVKVGYNNDSDSPVEDLLEEGDLLKLPGTARVVKIYRYFPDFDPAAGMNQTSMKPDNPRIIYSVYENNKLLGVGAAEFGEKVEIDTNTYVTFIGVKPFTVLKLKSDPGLPLVLGGGLLFMLGVSLSLLSTPVHRKKSGIIAGGLTITPDI
jgi:ResB protein required for cytochrome c biosynthesis